MSETALADGIWTHDHFKRAAGTAAATGDDWLDLQGRTIVVPDGIVMLNFDELPKIGVRNGHFIYQRHFDNETANRVTGAYASRRLAWFRVHGYGLWAKWGRGHDLHSTRKTAHYIGRLRWRVLRPGA